MNESDCIDCGRNEAVTDESVERMKLRIAQSSDFHKVSQAVYEQRIQACRACPNYAARICGQCGCVMEIMAMLANTRCLRGNPAWNIQSYS